MKSIVYSLIFVLTSSMVLADQLLQKIEWEDVKKKTSSADVVIIALIGNYEPRKDGIIPPDRNPSDMLDLYLMGAKKLAKSDEFKDKIAFYYNNSHAPDGIRDYDQILKKAAEMDKAYGVKTKRDSIPILYMFADGKFVKTWSYHESPGTFLENEVSQNIRKLLQKK